MIPGVVGPERVPVLPVVLDGQFPVQHARELVLDALGALLCRPTAGPAARSTRHRFGRERVVRAPAERVHPVDVLALGSARAVGRLEGKQRGEQPRAVPALDERVGGEVDARHQRLGIGRLENDPLVAVLVLVELGDGAHLLGAGVEDLPHLRDCVTEAGAVDVRKAQRGRARRRVAQLRLHRDVGGAHPEQVLGIGVPCRGRLGANPQELADAVEQSHRRRVRRQPARRRSFAPATNDGGTRSGRRWPELGPRES